MSELVSKQEQQKKIWTMLFIAGIVIFSVACFTIMNSRYDSLSRYPYKDQRSRQLIKQYLTSEEIEYIIEYSIEPNMFISFIQARGFNIYHAADYKKLSEYAWNASPQKIVSMIEETYEIIDTDTLIQYLDHYTYDELDIYLRKKDPYALDSELIMYASNADTWVDAKHTVSTRTPKYLQELDPAIPHQNTILISEMMKEPLTNLCNGINEEYRSTQGCGGLKIDRGYISYEQMKQMEANETFVPGHNEHQLGLAIDFGVPGLQEKDFVKTEQAQWLQDNAWKYGFVRTYTEEDVDLTGQQPNYAHYRYVGTDLARMLNESRSTFAKYAISRQN